MTECDENADANAMVVGEGGLGSILRPGQQDLRKTARYHLTDSSPCRVGDERSTSDAFRRVLLVVTKTLFPTSCLLPLKLLMGFRCPVTLTIDVVLLPVPSMGIGLTSPAVMDVDP